MTFASALHPRGPDGRFTSSFTHKLTEADRDRGNRIMDDFKPVKFRDAVTARHFLAANKPHLTTAEKGAVDRYTGDSFFQINRELRAGNSDDPEVKRLDAAMRPLPDDLLLTRTVGIEAFGHVDPESLQGSLINDAAYASSSVGPGAYGGGLSGVTMHIAAPKGTPAILAGSYSRNAGENEVVLARGMSMAVAKVVKNKYGGYDMYLIALPHDAAAAA